MPKLSDAAIQEAIKDSLQTEKNAMNFYRMAGGLVQRPQAKQLFELLAGEERDHARHFYNLYQGTDLPPFDEYMEQNLKHDREYLLQQEKALLSDLRIRKAMELAMEKEQALEKHLRAQADRIVDEEVRNIYLDNAESTRRHYLMIESEYAHLMGMVHETDIDTFVRE
ncbi:MULTISPECIES: ferritin-like domain-containing protein [Syntrophotalea]|jgi:rubrerythrin|uniref:Ferritin n=1 Tax=Syntrophotalea acetylenica TaxID=29542 RepID=A0A1L3GGK5_SYNAC|nr:ferritin family protein [Syntrophotalea acetylenica]APG25019.1 ferritin [Syntrophotalea acetylenica]APG43089.1 ferritin [Syntrophotalea acetylenica]MDY0260992.1 ferritin family protein [Syntrophotalea acetylenica]